MAFYELFLSSFIYAFLRISILRNGGFEVKDLVTTKGSLETTIIASKDAKNVYEIIRTFTNVKKEQKKEIILLTLYPTINEVNQLDLSGYHFNAHMEDMGVQTTHCLFLFSRVMDSRMSTRNIQPDEKNLEYIREALEKYKSAIVVIGFGSSMSKNSVVIDVKCRIIEMLQILRPNEPLYQIGGDGIEVTENYHPLFCGLRFGHKHWNLVPYSMPSNIKTELNISKKMKELKNENVLQISKNNKAKRSGN